MVKWLEWLFKGVASQGVVTGWQEGRAYSTDISAKALLSANQSWVYAIVDRLAKTVAQQNLRLYSRKPQAGAQSRFRYRPIDNERLKYLQKRANLQKYVNSDENIEEVLDHPLLDLFRNANSILNSFDLFYLTTQSLELQGNAYWHKERSGLGIVTALWPLQPQYVQVIADSDNWVKHYEYGVGSAVQKIQPTEIVYFKYPSITTKFVGSPPLAAGKTASDLLQYANEYEAAMFQNGGQPDVLMSFPEGVNIDEDAKNRMRREYAKNHSGPRKAGGMAFATGGAEIKPYSTSPKDMSYLKGREWGVKELCAVFGVPISFFRDEGVSKANAGVALENYMRNTILPKLIMQEETINQNLVPDFDPNLFVAYDNPVPEDKEYRLLEIKTHLEHKYTSINEEREVDGLEPAEWGQEPVSAGQPNIIGAPQEPEKRLRTKTKFPPLASPAPDFIPEEFFKALMDYFNEQGREIIAAIKPDELKAAKDILGPWFDMAIWDAKLAAVVKPFVRATFIFAGSRAMENLPEQARKPFNGTAADMLTNKRMGTIRQINRHTEDEIRQVVRDGIANGQSPEVIQRAIRAKFKTGEEGDVGRYRALRIARTETIWAHNEGAEAAYIQSGVITKKEWLTAGDERMCEFCASMNGTVITVGTSFYEKGDKHIGENGGEMSLDYESIEHPPLHCACRCSLIPVIE